MKKLESISNQRNAYHIPMKSIGENIIIKINYFFLYLVNDKCFFFKNDSFIHGKHNSMKLILNFFIIKIYITSINLQWIFFRIHLI